MLLRLEALVCLIKRSSTAEISRTRENRYSVLPLWTPDRLSQPIQHLVQVHRLSTTQSSMLLAVRHQAILLLVFDRKTSTRSRTRLALCQAFSAIVLWICLIYLVLIPPIPSSVSLQKYPFRMVHLQRYPSSLETKKMKVLCLH